MTSVPSRGARALARLKMQLPGHGFATEWTDDGLRVMLRAQPADPDTHDRAAEVLAEGLVTCVRRPDDGGRWWWLLDGRPLAEIDHLYDAVTALKGAVTAPEAESRRTR
ncbi:hypothetical protein [Actinomadura gamaensis]|uniref:Uncharacterized protein n=1 Tax=Actinomadura gamaensis TaxID=1763541 RepID=A0ABV9U9M9_9ACTN